MLHLQILPQRPSLSLRTGFTTRILAYMLDSLVRVSRRVERNHFVSIQRVVSIPKELGRSTVSAYHRSASDDHAINHMQPQLILAWSQPTLTITLAIQNISWPCTKTSARANLHSAHHCSSLPFNNFKYFLTLFSKFFSSFPHGTCSLSVSRQYLALDEIYHPLWAALPSNSTLRKRRTATLQVIDGTLTLSGALFQGT